jgi:hypothetical protein
MLSEPIKMDYLLLNERKTSRQNGLCVIFANTCTEIILGLEMEQNLKMAAGR